MTNQTPESVIAEVLDEERYYDRDQIGNESRVAEIVAALRAANMLREPCVPDAATADTKREAAVRELRNRYGASNGTHTWIEYQGDPNFIVNQILAALDGVPEPEVKP